MFLDEIDALQDESLISVLRQLRAGFTDRPNYFPASVALIGLRDVRDYKVKSGGQDRLTSPSPFNIAVRSITLRNFSAEEVSRLLEQHTEETGQLFLEDAIGRIFYLTQGQPWLVNSLAKVCVEELVEDWSQSIRVLSSGVQDSLPQIHPSWLTLQGKLDVDKLREAFLAFWRKHGQPLLRTAPYHEIAPHLVMMAFLHRVVNGRGSIEREYAIGSGRMDLLVRYGDTRLALELKTWRDGKKDPETEGLKQLDRYLDGLGLETGWLVIFDQRSNLPPIEERTSAATATTPAGREVIVIRG